MLAPSNVRDWEPDQAVLPYAEFRGDQIVVHNVRNCRYFDETRIVVEHEDRTYNLADLRGVDFFMVPFDGMPRLAHTMLSFEFAPPDGPAAAPGRAASKSARRRARTTPRGRARPASTS